MKFGEELIDDPTLSTFQKLFIKIWGVPILGLRIRAHAILPVIKKLSFENTHRLLDAGCGRALFTFFLSKFFPEAKITGIDINTDQLKINTQIAEKRSYPNCAFKDGDVTKLDPSGEWDFILSTDNLEHLKEDEKQCNVFFNALKPKGYLLIHTPHYTRNLFGIRVTNFMEIEGHVRPGYTLPGLKEMLQKAGFVVHHAEYNYGYFETLANHISYIITGGREKRRWLYATLFPFLLGLSQFSRLEPRHEGSGLVFLAQKPETSK